MRESFCLDFPFPNNEFQLLVFLANEFPVVGMSKAVKGPDLVMPALKTAFTCR